MTLLPLPFAPFLHLCGAFLAPSRVSGVQLAVCGVRQGNEVIRPVVVLDAVDVVHVLIGSKGTAVGFLPDQTVLPDIAALVGRRMIGTVNKHVPALVLEAPAFPVGRAISPIAARSVSGQKTDGVSEHRTPCPIRARRKRSALTASALAKAARIRRGLFGPELHVLGACFGSAGPMAPEITRGKTGYGPLTRVRVTRDGDRGATTTKA